MEDDFLSNYMLPYIETDITWHFDVDTIINTFYIIKERRAQF